MLRKPTITIPAGSCIDSYLYRHREPTVFRLEPGYYTTRGHWAFNDSGRDCCGLAAGCELVGAGSGQTELSLDETNAPPGAKQHEVLTGGSRARYSESIRIEGLTVDCYSDSGTPTVGVHVWSYGVRVHDVVVRSVSGNRAVAEGFGVLVNEPGEQSPLLGTSGAHVSDVTVATLSSVDPGVENFVCACYVGYAHPGAPSIAERITVVGEITNPAHAAFAGNFDVRFRDCRNTGRWNHGFFCDTGPGGNLWMVDSHLRAEYAIAAIRSQGHPWTDIHFRNCVMDLVRGGTADHAAGLVVADEYPGKAKAEFSRVQIRDSVLRTAVPNTYAGSLDAVNAVRCGVPRAANEFVGLWAPAVIGDKLAPKPVWLV